MYKQFFTRLENKQHKLKLEKNELLHSKKKVEFVFECRK